MYGFMETNDLYPIEQKGCRRGSYGCKDQLLINQMIIKDCKSKHINLSMAWIGYPKAFDSVPHSWILKVLDSYIPFVKKKSTISNIGRCNLMIDP